MRDRLPWNFAGQLNLDIINGKKPTIPTPEQAAWDYVWNETPEQRFARQLREFGCRVFGLFCDTPESR